MNMKQTIVSKIKVLVWLSLLAAGIIFAPNAYMMPKELCITNGNISSVRLRLRARVVYIDEDRTHQQRGDIYSENYTVIPKKANHCMQTSNLVKLFRRKDLGDNDYYLTNVRVDVKARSDCQLSGDESVHSWIDAPKTARVNFQMKFKGFWHSCDQT